MLEKVATTFDERMQRNGLHAVKNTRAIKELLWFEFLKDEGNRGVGPFRRFYSVTEEGQAWREQHPLETA